jgi:hypothetical protein
MRGTTLLQHVAALAGLALAGACGEDPVAPPMLDERPVSRSDMAVQPRSATIAAGQVVFLKVMLTSQYGDRFEPVGVVWKSSNDAIAIVSQQGEVLGTREGQAVITATMLGESQSSIIRVLPGTQGKEQRPNVEEGRF